MWEMRGLQDEGGRRVASSWYLIGLVLLLFQKRIYFYVNTNKCFFCFAKNSNIAFYKVVELLLLDTGEICNQCYCWSV